MITLATKEFVLISVPGSFLTRSVKFSPLIAIHADESFTIFVRSKSYFLLTGTPYLGDSVAQITD